MTQKFIEFIQLKYNLPDEQSVINYLDVLGSTFTLFGLLREWENTLTV